MMTKRLSTKSLLKEIQKLNQEVEILKTQKVDLEIILENTTIHADHLVEILHTTTLELYAANQKLEKEITEKEKIEAELQYLLEVVNKDKEDLEIMLEMTAEHGDILQQLLHDQSIKDHLTGLYNRNYLESFLQKELEQAETLGIIMIDIDHFKRFNDNFGHQAGDLVLKKVADLLQKSIRTSDIVCRYGGEEMTVILPKASLEITVMRAEQMRNEVKNLSLEYDGKSLGHITISLGVACFPQHGKIGEKLIKIADTALYQAKAQGRDQVVTATR